MWPQALSQRQRHSYAKNNVHDNQQLQSSKADSEKSQPVKLLEEMTMTRDAEHTALLLTRQPSSPTVSATSTNTSCSIGSENDNEEDWEALDPTATTATALPTKTARVWYWTTHTFPILLFDALRLGLFVIFLAPAFASFLWYYFTCDRLVLPYKTPEEETSTARSTTSSWRHVVDVYGAATATSTTTSTHDTSTNTTAAKKPVLIFFTGGAWVIGYKMWGAFLAKVFCAMGVLVVIPDYPNYPFVTVPEMVEDAEAAIQWTLNTIEQYGGDPERVILAGQSAGGHLASCVLLRKARQLLLGDEPLTGFHPTQLAGFCSISSPSDVQAMATNFQKHGLDQAFVQSLFGCHTPRKTCMDDYDPQRLVEQLTRHVEELGYANGGGNVGGVNRNLDSILPPMSIFHGTADQTVPYEVSEKFVASLQQAGITTEYIAYEGWSHTDPILEAIMMADHRFHADLYDRLYQWTNNKQQCNNSNSPNSNTHHSKQQRLIPLQLDDSIPECQPLCPTFLVQAARFCNPF